MVDAWLSGNACTAIRRLPMCGVGSQNKSYIARVFALILFSIVSPEFMSPEFKNYSVVAHSIINFSKGRITNSLKFTSNWKIQIVQNIWIIIHNSIKIIDAMIFIVFHVIFIFISAKKPPTRIRSFDWI
jgi:hypothetical protein